jgi:DNA repair protein RadD
MKELRLYQSEGKNKLRASMKKGNKRVIYYLPTGGGKSICAVDLIKSLSANGKKVAFLANRIGLVWQFSKHLDDAGIPHGIIQGQNTFGTSQQVIVASIATVGRRGLPPVDFCIIDEAHAAAGSNEYKKLMFALNNIYWVGLTATPFAKGLSKKYPELQNEPLFQDLVVGATIRELIELGSLVDCEIFAPVDPDLTGVRMQRNGFGEMDYNEKDLGKAVDKVELVGDIIKHWKLLANNKKTVVFATNVSHSKHIIDQFQKDGIKAEHIDGYMTDDEKQPILDRFSKGETLILSNVAMLREGWDVPSCSCMVLAKPTRSLISWVQMVGRILRPFADKTHGIVLDHSGSVNRLGYPTDDLPLELCDGTKKESPAEKKLKEKKKDRKCHKCHFIKQTHECPKCGFKPEKKTDIVIEDGELKRILKATKFDKQSWYSQLICYAKSKGYAKGWAAHKYQNKFGVWPKGLQETHIQPGSEVLGYIQYLNIKHAYGAKK